MADECDLDELTAFLEASDSELDDEITDNIHGDKHEINKVTSTNNESNDADKRHFTDILDSDNHDNSEEHHATVDIPGKTENQSESMLSGTSKLESQSSNQSGASKLESLSTNQSGTSKLESQTPIVDKSDYDNKKDDACPAIDTDNIKAEMQAMAERMKQLEKLLHQSQSSPAVSSPKFELKEKRKSTSPNIKSTSLNRKSDSPNIKSESSKRKSTSPKIKCTSSNRTSTSPSERTVNKSKCSFNDKGTSSLPGQTGSTHKNEIRSSTCDKLTVKSDSRSKPMLSLHKKYDDNLNTKKSPKLKSTTNGYDDDNPFFTNDKSTSVSGTTDNDDVINSRSIFGESDDSDWEDLAGEEKHELSKEGKDIKKLIVQGQKKRQAHTPSYDTNLLKKPDLTKWSDKPRPPIKLQSIYSNTGSRSNMSQSTQPVINPETGTVSGKYKLKDEYMVKSNIVKEDERETVTDPFCGIRIINPRISMSEFKLKMEGRSMIKIPKLLSKYNKSDLQKENFVVIGVVVSKSEPRQSAGGKTYCIWKLNDLQDCDKTITFFLFGNVYKEHWKNDLGVVIGLLNPSFMDKAEKSQSEVAMTIQHPQQLLMLGISKDLGRCRSTTKSGQPCSSFINKQQGEFCSYHVQQAYRKSSSKRTELQASTGVQPKAFAAKKMNSQKDGFFFYGGNTYTTMRPQAKSSKDSVTLKKLQSYDASKPQGKITTMSLHELEAEDKKKINKLAEKDKQLLSMLSVPTAGSMNFVKHLVKKDATKSFVKSGDSDDDIKGTVSARDLLKEHTQLIVQKKRETALLSSTPTIGKGLTSGQVISLDVPVKKKPGSASAEFAKQLAIAKIKAKGGVKKEDPNNVSKKLLSPEAKEKIRKRVAEDTDLESSTSQDPDSREPPRKKSKFLGDLDLNSPEVQKLLKKKSKHTGALAEAESEHEDRYFSALEKKEKMEEKMDSITEVSVKLVYCVQCKYKYFSAHERCKKENHILKYINGVKRFYKCKHCKKRIVCLEKFPTSPCDQCGNTNYQRVSMVQEKKGPKLESEELCLRGNEQKFIGSLQGKAYFNG